MLAQVDHHRKFLSLLLDLDRYVGVEALVPNRKELYAVSWLDRSSDQGGSKDVPAGMVGRVEQSVFATEIDAFSAYLLTVRSRWNQHSVPYLRRTLWQVGVFFQCDNGEFSGLVCAHESCPHGGPVLVKGAEELAGVVDKAPDTVGAV